MARIRTIKPDFWRNEALSSVSPEAALLAIGLLNFADDEGYFRANPRLIQCDIFPLRECSVSTHVLLDELSSIDYVRVKTGSDGTQIGQIVNFAKHQVINRKTSSELKELLGFTEDSVSDHGALTTGKERKGKERKGKEGNINAQKTNTSESNSQPKKTQTANAAACIPKPDEVTQQVWDDFLQTRKAKRSPITKTALDAIEREAIRAGFSLQDALRECTARGWQGFKADWVAKPLKPNLSDPNTIDEKTARAFEQVFGKPMQPRGN